MRIPLAALVAIAIAVPAAAQTPAAVPGTPDVTRVAAGSYTVDPDHTEVGFGVMHMGITPYYGLLSQASGSLTVDPAKPTAARVSVTVPVASLYTPSAKLTGELTSADWLDAAKFPTASFVSTIVEVQGSEARITGMLTLHGVTRPVRMDARFVGAGANPMTKAGNIGFQGRAVIKRSDFGVTKYVPLVADEVQLTITAAFVKTPG